MRKGPLDATLEATPAGDASAGDSSVRDAWPETADLSTRADLGERADISLAADGPAGCTPLPVTWLSEPDVGTCPPTAGPSACGGGDVGAVVARSAACVNAWGQVPIQCVMWEGPAANEEIVVIKLANCTDSLDSATAFACSDHIEFTYVGHGTCQSCDGKRSDLRAFNLPLDGRPVIATGQIIEPPCLPPPLPDATTGTGGVSGTGGTTGAGGAGCAPTPISESQAATVYAAYAMQDTPGLDPSVTFAAQEKTVPGLWEEIRAQLFSGKIYTAGSSAWSECSFIYRDCALTMLTDDCTSFGPIASGVAANGAFYYSWGSGSGVFRSTLGKLAPSGSTLAKTTSIEYFNRSYGPPGLVIAREGEPLLVYRATVDLGKFNEWKDPELMGTLKDFGDRLAIVDNNGQELPSTLP